MIKFMYRKIERVQVIFKVGEEDKVRTWLNRTRYTPYEERPVHRMVLENAQRKPRKAIKNPRGMRKALSLVKGYRMLLCERGFDPNPRKP